MATQRALPYPDTSSSPPGIALVRGLDASATFKPSYWERSLVRLCLYPLPAIWAAFHLAAAHATLAHLSDNLADLRFLVALSFTWIAATEFFHAVGCERSNREHTGAMAVLVSVFVASGAAALLLILLDIHLPGILPCASEAAFLFFASVIVKIWLKRIFRSHGRTTSVAVVDTYIHRGEVSWILARKRVSRHEISGAIRLDELGTSGVTKIFHSMDELVKEIQCEPTEGVLISALPEYTSILSQSLSAHGGVDAPVRFVLDSRDSAVSRQRFSSANCIYLMNTGAEPEKTLHYLILKRAFDIMFSLVAIIAGLPLIALIALAIKISSRGGIFFVQDRVGWNGKIFRMYKFRTMHAVPPGESDTRWSGPDDDRVTSVGNFLRNYSLDELPQFINVLRGEMSVVGPRPERPYFVNSFRSEIDEYHRRHQIKVGITGWAQVNGLRGDTCIRTRVMYDLYYLQNWGLIFDLKIILRTVLCVFCGRNAD